jgi:DNA-binding IclR family transcriptional regulator
VRTSLQHAALRAALLAGNERDPRLSRSLLRGLSLLAGFGENTGERGIVELAHELHMSPGTAHRYARTLVALELLEHSPTTRRYRLPRG